MTDVKRPAAGRNGTPVAAAIPPFHLRIPDVFAEQAPAAIVARPAVAAPPRDAIAAARAKLNEKRILDGQRQVTSLIAGARDRRRRLFGRLWAASILLTALSVVALAVELVQRMDFFNPIGDTVQIDDQKPAGSPRGASRDAADHQPPPGSAAPREWSNQLPPEESVQSANFERASPEKREGAWFSGTISDSDTETPRRGDIHDDHQSRPD